ncbi:tyrosine integrase/recombinase [Halobacterium phage phiH]|uniref:Integrase n=2 Tax=root TaxID=1 RepID=A0A3G1ZKS4_BPPHH|nr:site-specific integrase [Halobacterium phage phiH]AYM00294.1 tyrosine integrase/recombinase [Halobacterium phage phiH]
MGSISVQKSNTIRGVTVKPGQQMISDDVHWLKPDQVDRMRDGVRDGCHPQRDEAIITLLYDTGLRRAELSQLNRQMLDLEDELLLIPSRIQKGLPTDQEPRPATFELDRGENLGTIATLEAYLETRDDVEALFPSQMSPRMSPKGVNDVVKRAARDAGICPYAFEKRGEPTDVSAHTLRHSVAWRMLRVEEGNTLYDVRNRLRHRSILTTERSYDHFETI